MGSMLNIPSRMEGPEQKTIIGKSEITISEKGIANGKSVYLNDGADFGPDTKLGATTPGQYGPPYTQTVGLQEADTYVHSKNFIQGYGQAGTIRMTEGEFGLIATYKPSNYTRLIGTGEIQTQLFAGASGMTVIKNNASASFTHNEFSNFSINSFGQGATALDIEQPENASSNMFENIVIVGQWSAAPYKFIGVEGTRLKNFKVEQQGTSPFGQISTPGGSFFVEKSTLGNVSVAAQIMSIERTVLQQISLSDTTNIMVLDRSYQANPFSGNRIILNGFVVQNMIIKNSMLGLSSSASLFDLSVTNSAINSLSMENCHLQNLDGTTVNWSTGTLAPTHLHTKYITIEGTISGLPFDVYNNISNNYVVSTPAVPASGTAQQNTNPFPVMVYVYGGTVTAIDYTPAGGTAIEVGTAGPASIRLNTGDSITLTYSATPSWKWASA